MKSTKDYEEEVKKNPSIIYNINPDTVIKQNNIVWSDAHEFLASHIKYNKSLYYFASEEGEKFHKNLTHLAILIGWGVNLFTIIVTSHNNNISNNLVTTINSIGNLLSVIVITVVNFYSLQEEIIVFRRHAHDLNQLQSSIEFSSCMLLAQNKTQEEMKNNYNNYYQKFLHLQQINRFPVRKRTQDKFYKGIGSRDLNEMYNNLFRIFSKKIVNELNKGKEENEKIIT